MPQIDPGDYHGTIKTIGLVEGRTAPYLFVEVDVTHILANGAWAPTEAVTRTLRFSFAEAAYEYTQKKLKHLGFTGDFQNPAFSDEIMNSGVHVKCEHQNRDNKTYEQWDLANWGSTERKAVTQETVAKLTARWGQDQKTAAPPVGQPAPPAAASAAPPAPTAPLAPPDDHDGPPLSEDDIPF